MDTNSAQNFGLFEDFVQKRFARFLCKHGYASPAIVKEDATLDRYKFTNVFRHCDRVSQYLINLINADVAHNGFPKTLEEKRRLAAIIYIFRLFGRIDTWERIPDDFKDVPHVKIKKLIKWADHQMFDRGERLYTTAYIMGSCEGVTRNAFYLTGLENYILRKPEALDTLLFSFEVAPRFELLRTLPGFGGFLAYQFALDYSYVRVDFQHLRDFCVAGPGAQRGASKLTGGKISKKAVEALCIQLSNLYQETGRPFAGVTFDGCYLKANDIQNCLCEFDKYCRDAAPHLEGKGEAKRRTIKHAYNPRHDVFEVQRPVGWGTQADAENVSFRIA